jgi:hypothetical protein
VVCIEQPQLFRLAKLLIAGHRRRPDPMLVASNSVGLPLRIIAAAFFFKPAFHRIEDVVRLS